MKGLEPPRRSRHQILSLAWLPITPHPQSFCKSRQNRLLLQNDSFYPYGFNTPFIGLEGTVLFNFAALVFLLAARQFANYVCIALAGSVGCEQKEPKKL